MGATLDRLRTHYAGRRVLVTGSTGFKGSWLCRMLLLLGADVAGYALEPPTDPSLWEVLGLSGEVRQTYADVRDLGALREAFDTFRPQTALHLAAQPLVVESYRDPVGTYSTNVMGTVNMLECARLCGSVTSLVNVTTDKVYENPERPGHAFREGDRLDGWDPYSNSKGCSELVTHAYARSFFSEGALGEAAGRCAVSTARAGNVVGGGDFADMRIVPDCVRAALSGDALVLRNPGSVRPYQHVLEPLSAYLMLAALQDGDRTLAGAYNIGPDRGSCVTTGEVARLFGEAWGEGFSFEAGPWDGPHEAGLLVLDNSKAKDALGWRPRWDVAEAIRRTVEWTRAWQAGDATAETDRQIMDYLEGME